MFTITRSATTAGGTCPAGAPSGDTCLTDKQIQDELDLQIKNGVLPAADENALYTTYFPPKYFITDSGGSGSCVGGGFCGYHGTATGTASGHEFYYGVLPDHGKGSNCDTGCGTTCASGDTACYFDNLTSTSGHELCEAITDAEVGLNTDASLAWYDPGDNDKNQNGEIGDMCNSNTLVRRFNVQNVFSNVVAATDMSHACVVSRVAANDFSVSFASNKKKLAAGTSIQVPVTTTTTSGSPRTPPLSFSGQSAGVHPSLDHTTVASGSGATLTLAAHSNAAT